MKQLFASLILGLLVSFTTPFAHAQATVESSSETLAQLYEEQLEKPDNQYIEKRVEAEEAKLAKLLKEKLVTTTTELRNKAEEKKDSSGVQVGTVEVQRTYVQSVQAKISELEATKALLEAEQELYKSSTEDEPALPDSVAKMTTSLEENKAELFSTNVQIKELERILILEKSKLTSLEKSAVSDQFDLAFTVAKYLLLFLILYFIQSLIRTKFLSKITDDSRRYTLTKLFTSGFYFLVIVIPLFMLIAKNKNLLASAAIISAGIAFALQDVIKDIMGFFLIIKNKIFTRGDRISMPMMCGDVVDITLLRTTLLEVGTEESHNSERALERTGKLLSVPNAMFINSMVTNHSKSSNYIRAEIKVTITFESNWEKAFDMFKDIINEHTEDYANRDVAQSKQRTKELYYIPHKTAGNQVYVHIAADGVEFTLRFTIPIGERRPISTAINKDVLKAIDATEDIELAYTTIRYYQKD